MRIRLLEISLNQRNVRCEWTLRGQFRLPAPFHAPLPLKRFWIIRSLLRSRSPGFLPTPLRFSAPLTVADNWSQHVHQNNRKRSAHAHVRNRNYHPTSTALLHYRVSELLWKLAHLSQRKRCRCDTLYAFTFYERISTGCNLNAFSDLLEFSRTAHLNIALVKLSNCCL